MTLVNQTSPIDFWEVANAYNQSIGGKVQRSDLYRICDGQYKWPVPDDFGRQLLVSLTNDPSGLSTGTIHKIMKLAKRIINWQCNRDGNVPPPWPKVKAPKSKMRYLSADEVEKVRSLFKWATPYNSACLHAVFDILLYTGCRLGELKLLSWGDVKQWETITITHPKTKTVSTIALHPRLKESLEKLSKFHTGEHFYLFSKEELQWLEYKLRGVINTVCNTSDKLELYGRATIHSLRHTFATDALGRGVDLGVVAYALGHTSIKQTMMYMHIHEQKLLAEKAQKGFW